MAKPPRVLRQNDALLIVDVQNDFLSGGALAVPDADAVIPLLNRYIKAFQEASLPIFITRDWHPRDHCSFKPQGGLWPPHCVAGSRGAQFAPGLNLPPDIMIISKATGRGADAYSGFEGTDLNAGLKKLSIRRLFIGGLATDYCVLGTVKDALAKGYGVVLLVDAIRAVNVDPGDGGRAIEEMKMLGAVPKNLAEVVG